MRLHDCVAEVYYVLQLQLSVRYKYFSAVTTTYDSTNAETQVRTCSTVIRKFLKSDVIALLFGGMISRTARKVRRYKIHFTVLGEHHDRLFLMITSKSVRILIGAIVYCEFLTFEIRMTIVRICTWSLKAAKGPN